jgi:predicted N-formylglutamate amidohydrolase
MLQTNRSVKKLLGQSDPPPVGVRNGALKSPFMLICDHAGNAVPKALNDLGLSRNELDRHIGIDIGILGVSEVLADLLEAPLVFQRYSRLVVECNRLFTSPDSIATISDGTSVPQNAGVGDNDRSLRINEIAVPYHQEIASRLDQRAAADVPTILLSMHSFTPSLLARPSNRPWQIGLCYDADTRFTRHVLDAIEKIPNMIIGRNEPYGVDMLRDYSIPVHAEARQIPYAEFELRQDLISTMPGQREWGERLAVVVREAYAAFEGGKQ